MLDSYLDQAQLSLQAQAAPAAARRSASPGTPDSARAAAEEFEAMFVSQMLGSMFEGIETDGMFGGGHGEKVFRSLLVQEYGKIVARAGGIGLADAVQRQILTMQEGDAA
jgi:Rod binding domain-containing protein